MNIKTTLALAVTLLLASNVHAGPQDATKPMDHSKMKMDHADMKMPTTPEARAKMANTMFDKIDANHHALDHAAHAPSSGVAFAKLDGNKDGKLSKAEMAKHPMAAHFPMMDTDKNGFLSPTEAAAHGL